MDPGARQLAAWGSFSAFLAVALGAFGAHALGGELNPRQMEIFRTGVHYQMVHALAVILVSTLARPSGVRGVMPAAWCFLAGTILFSGSLYTLALTGMDRFGAITPGGGLLFLVGWLLLAIRCVRGGREDSIRPGPST